MATKRRLARLLYKIKIRIKNKINQAKYRYYKQLINKRR